MAVYRSPDRMPSSWRQLSSPGVTKALKELDEKLTKAKQEAAKEARNATLAEDSQRVKQAEDATKKAQTERDAAVKKAEENVMARFAVLLENLGKALNAVETARSEALKAGESDLVDLSLAVAGRLIGRELEQEDKAWVQRAVQEGLTAVADRMAVTLRLTAKDAEAVGAQVQAVMARSGVRLNVQGDPDLPEGSCVLESAGTVIDASMATAWRRLADCFADRLPPKGWRLAFEKT